MHRRTGAPILIIFILIPFILALGLAVPGLSGAVPADNPKAATKAMEITDMAGRQIRLNRPPQKIIAIGSALRLYTYVAGTDMLAGVERKQQKVSFGRPYIMANPSLENLPVIGEGHPDDPDPELIIRAGADVIIAGDIMDPKSLELLQERTGVKVVIISMGRGTLFDETFYRAIRIIGQITGKQARADSLVRFMENCKAELSELTRSIPSHEKPRIYIGGLSYKGIHGIESTACKSDVLNVIRAENVADELKATGSVMIDKEKLIQWDPDILVIDAGGLGLVKRDQERSPEFYNTLSAVRNKKVYCQLPDVSYYRNIETAMVNTYFLGTLLYPRAFKSINPVDKADEIYTFMLGAPLYEKMAGLYGGFKPVCFGK